MLLFSNGLIHKLKKIGEGSSHFSLLLFCFSCLRLHFMVEGLNDHLSPLP